VSVSGAVKAPAPEAQPQRPRARGHAGHAHVAVTLSRVPLSVMKAACVALST